MRCMSYAVDVADEAAMKTFAAAVQSRFGAPHVLINNAGIGYLGLFLRSDLEHWQRIPMSMSWAWCMAAIFPADDDRGRRASSFAQCLLVGRQLPSPSMGAYAASKGAVSIWTEGLKMELADSNVHVTTVCPGVINTPIVRNWAGVAPVYPARDLAKCATTTSAKAVLRGGRQGDGKGRPQNGDIVLSGPKVGLAYHAACIGEADTRHHDRFLTQGRLPLSPHRTRNTS